MVKTVWTYLGLSTDDKTKLPQLDQHKVTGTVFFAMDTSTAYMYNAATDQWYAV